MTDSDIQTETWKPIPGAKDYLVSDQGRIRSLPRTKNGRFYEGRDPLKLREDGDGYLMFNYTDDEGVRHHNVSVARTVLLAHDPDGYRPGLQACHSPAAPDGSGGRKDNRLVKLRWDTEDANREEALALRLVNTPPKVKPPKVCPRCGAEHAERGRNCRACFEGIGVQFAQLLADGVPPEKAAERVDYPLNGALNLAVRYGGLRFMTEAGLNVMLRAASHPEKPRRWRNTLKWGHR